MTQFRRQSSAQRISRQNSQQAIENKEKAK